jgi:ClpX C4-type zinc finger
MTLDEHLLEKARSEAARLAAAEREALLARADYHSAVRRLHLGGGSLREIAERLGLSHQRVQQIVSAAGGSWWQRVWQSRNARRDAVCTFCGRPPSEVAKLIAGPNVFICDACVAHAERAAEGADTRAFVLSRSAVALCSFCRKRRTRERVVISTSDANICGDCLGVCRQILDHRAA